MANATITPHPNSPQEKFSTFRQLKVRKSYYPYQLADSHPHNTQPVPRVEIKGYWLNQAGFTIDTQLTVEVQSGCIILKPKATAA